MSFILSVWRKVGKERGDTTDSLDSLVNVRNVSSNNNVTKNLNKLCDELIKRFNEFEDSTSPKEAKANTKTKKNDGK